MLRLIDHSFKRPSENIALDDVILDGVNDGLTEATLRIWESPVPFVVMGTGQISAEVVNIEACRSDKKFAAHLKEGESAFNKLRERDGMEGDLPDNPFKDKKDLLEKYPGLPITLDPSELSTCNKVLCTSTTVLNNSLDNILSHCAPDAFVL